MIMLKSKIAEALEKHGESVRAQVEKEWTRKMTEEMERVNREHEIELAAARAEIARLNNKIDKHEAARRDVDAKRLQANELIVTAKALINEIAEEVADGFDVFRRLHGLFDRVKIDVGRLEK